MKTVKQLIEGKGAFADWARENKANKAKDRAATQASIKQQKTLRNARRKEEATIRKHHDSLIKTAHGAEHHGNQAGWEDAIAAIYDHQRKHPHLKLPDYLGESMTEMVAPPRAESIPTGHIHAYFQHYKQYQRWQGKDDKLAAYHQDMANHHAHEFHNSTGKKIWNPEAHETEHVTIGEDHNPTTYLDKPPGIARLNTILDQLTAKHFVNLQVFVDAVRAALDFHGFKLPHLDCEQETHGPNYARSYGDMIHGPGFEDARTTPAIPTEFEYVFQVKYADITGGVEPEEYLYMCANRIESAVGDKDGQLWETYAQVVTPEELAELIEMPDDREFPELVGDASGETGYLRLQRHVNTSGTSPDADD